MILIYELPETVSKSALSLTPFTFSIATGYVTLALAGTNIASDLLSPNLSHMYGMYSICFYILKKF